METTKARLRGEVKILPLGAVKPNGWNPNTMTPEMKASLKHGLVEDGWLVSQALLVWASDENDDDKMLIIDGEHRYQAAVELGMEKGPMVLLDGISEAEAKSLTVKMNQKRGDWNVDALSSLLKELETTDRGVEAIDLGFGDEELMKLLATPPAELPPPDAPPVAAPAPTSSGEGGGEKPRTSSVRMVQLFLDDTSQPAFMEDMKSWSEKWGTKNATDTVLELVKRAKAAGL